MTASPDGCEFCAIVAGELDAEVVCEGADWIAFFPHSPATTGHTLVVPRGHVADLWSLDRALAGPLMKAVILVGRAIDSALSPEGMNLISSAGQTAEQTVFHLHLHVVPRWRDDGFGTIWPPSAGHAQGELDEVAARIKAACYDEQLRTDEGLA